MPPNLSAIHFVLIDRATMGRVHRDFLGDPAATDVITFPYGEILVCPAVAQERAAEFGFEVEQEIVLYALHGLLHLTGYDDTTPKLAKELAGAQARLLKKILTLS